MKSIYAFIGPAGSGKTYSLSSKLTKVCAEQELLEYQSVLAITFMHGSRRRLAAKLGKQVSSKVPIICETIDSFCLRLVNRYRSRIQKHKVIVIGGYVGEWSENASCWKANFALVRAALLRVLEDSGVRQAIAAAYPIIVIDEFQDCDGDLLRIVERLSEFSTLLVGADDFQDLNSIGDSPAVSWLKTSKCKIEELSGNHRTENNLLLASATALRDESISMSAIELIPRPDKHGGLVAFEIAKRVVWGKLKKGASHALITPVSPDTSNWVKGVMKSLGKELANGKLPPVPFRWEDSGREKCDKALAVIAEFADADGMCPKAELQQLEDCKDPILRLATGRALRLMALRGGSLLPVEELQQIVALAAHSIGAFGSQRQTARLAMTIHGAKNREFDYVFIVWPYQVPVEPIKKRKLLYNAITRARLGAFLFVQGDEKRVKNDDTLRLLESGLVASDQPKKKSKKSSSK